MRPLKLVAWGFLVVVLDITVGGLDVLPEFLGWLIAYVGLRNLDAIASAVFVVFLCTGVMERAISAGDPAAGSYAGAVGPAAPAG